MARVLVIEDEQDLAELLVYNLKKAGLEVEAVGTGSSGIARARAHPPDLVLLDLMLPDIAGTEVLRMIRETPSLAQLPVMIVTAKGQEQDRILGLELGADDYVVKPFSVRELVLRVQAVLRRGAGEGTGGGGGEILQAGALRLDPVRHEVTSGGQPVTLTALEFRLLKTFLERPGRVQTREVLLSDVWGIQADITTRTVDTHVKRLREKLGPAGDLIETIRGVGYKLVTAEG